MSGSEVKAGDVIAELDRDLLEAPAAQAAAAAQSAEAQRDALIRTRTSNAAWAITSDDIEAAEAAADQAQAAAEAARVQLEQTRITAPITGTISQINATVGQLAGPTAPIVSIVASDLEVKLTVDENRLPLIEVGQPVSCTVSAYPGELFGRQVSAVSPTIDRTSRTGEVTISIEEGGPSGLVAGMFARVAITTAERPNVTVVPRAAVITRGQESFVYVITDGLAQRRTVTIGRPTDNADLVEIAEGVVPGEQVALTPSILTDGEQVTIFGG